MAKKKEAARVRKLGVSEFKSHCLAVFREMRRRPVEVVITHRGEEIARILPSRPRTRGSSFGMLKGIVKPVGDIANVSFEDEWETVEKWDRLNK